LNEQNKRKFALWIYPQTLKKIEEIYKQDNCQSQSEFIEKAVTFYLGYLSANKNMNYFPKAISGVVDGIVSGSENRLARLMFKQAVVLAKLCKLLAIAYNFDESEYSKLHYECVEEVKRINGYIKIEKPDKWSDE